MELREDSGRKLLKKHTHRLQIDMFTVNWRMFFL